MFFDTHAHLDSSKFASDRDEVISSLPQAGISLVLNAACDMPSCYTTLELTRKWSFIYGAVGVHPHSAEEMTDADLEELEKLTHEPKIMAIGEIGLDYHYNYSPKDTQKKRFADQLELARKLSLPVIIHDREAHEDCLNILRDFADLKVVYHCYSGSLEYARELIDLGFYLSFNGAATFENAKTAPRVIEWMPKDRLMLETDCPYLTPVPYRGKRNSPAYIPAIAEKFSEYTGIPTEELARITTENGKRFFGIE